MKTRSIFLIASILLISIELHAQTSDCDNTPGGQLTVGTSCTPTTFNSNNNTDYWNAALVEGFCGETDQDDAWMWFDATSTSTTVTYTPTSGNPILTIFQGACSAGMTTNIDCSNNAGLAAETVTFPTIPGTRYRIRIQNNLSDASMNGTVCAFNAGGGITTASDCPNAVNICTNLSFTIDPNGFGVTDEIPAPGSLGNPDINPFSSNAGCLLAGETNSTWMIVNVATSGLLEFVFGGLGSQAGFYDWIMYPYNGAASCTAISNNTLAPVSCNWNGVDFGGTGLSNTIPAGGDASNFEPPISVLAGQRYIIVFSNYSSVSTTVPLQFLTDPGDATVSCTPLGINLGSLSVECLNGSTEIQWQSSIDSDVLNYTIESSRDLQEWFELGTIENGLQNGDVLQYSFLDYSNQLRYYRIKENTTDGEFSYSEVTTVNCFDDETFTLFPNPSDGNLQLSYKRPNGATLQFLNMTGGIVFEQTLEEATQEKNIIINAIELEPGIYQYRMMSEIETKSGILIITK
jgi:hypothetical protein